MGREHVYKYLSTETAREKYMDVHLRHIAPPSQKNPSDLFTLLTKLPVDRDTRNIPLLTWNHILNITRDFYKIVPSTEHNIVLLKQTRLEIPAHTHTYFELIYVLSGSSVQYINQNPETFSEGDFCILPPHAIHSQNSCPNGLAIKILVHPSTFTDICTGLLKGQDTLSHFLLDSIYNKNSEQYLLFRTGEDPEIRERILDMFEEMLSADVFTDRILTGMLITLLVKLSRHWQAAVESVPVKNVDHEILTFLQENYSTITLEELAAHLHYTVPYCSRYIKKLFGCTFSQLLNRIRFQNADLLLKNSGLTVNQISKMLGYENPENFMRAFKKKYQMTPSQYRDFYAESKKNDDPTKANAPSSTVQ